MVTIFFAISLSKAELPHWFNWILVAFVAFHVLIHLILSVSSFGVHDDFHPRKFAITHFHASFLLSVKISRCLKLTCWPWMRLFAFSPSFLHYYFWVHNHFLSLFRFLSLIIPLPLLCQITITISNVIIVRFSFGFRFAVALASGTRNVWTISPWPICHRHAVAWKNVKWMHR